jgi:sulfur relay (sulfurtransferase) DsrC/TusE family protein
VTREPHRRTILTDAEGYLVDLSEWTEELADEVARSEGIALRGEHWKVCVPPAQVCTVVAE